MADVLKIAHERRAELRAEIAKLDEFIRMGEALIRYSRANAAKHEAGAAPVKRPASVPPGNNSERIAQKPAAHAGNGSEISRPTVIRQGNSAN